MRRTALISLALLTTFAVVAACSGESSNDFDDGDDPGGAGVGGSAGASPSGGTGASGASGTGGATTGGSTSGGSATGGSATGGNATGGNATGGSATGGSATGGGAGAAARGGGAGTTPTGGVGGSGGGGRECESADDCMLFTDCCSCEAVPKGTSIVPCDLLCITDHCSALQIRPEEVACSFGRCVIDRSCDHANATCGSPPEACPSGEVRSVSENGCFGPCLPSTECRDVTDCASCGSNAVCVIEEPQIRSFGCVEPAASCEKGSYCECLGACPTSGFVCMEADDAVHCPCPVC
jgi:hypothetical protein